jgi:NADH-quinone oxidoreductase subunit G
MAEGICPGCATGCAAYIDSDENHVYRLRPRRDDDVNRVWLCDDGVLSGWLHNDDRIDEPLVGGEPAEPGRALREGASLLEDARGRAVAVVSAEHTVEDNLALVRFAREVLDVSDFYLAARPDGEEDRLLRSADKNPNRAGATAAAGGEVRPVDDLAGSGAGFVVALGGLGEPPPDARVLAIGARRGEMTAGADVVLVAATFAQCSGSYINAKGMRRSFEAAVHPKVHEPPLPAPVSAVIDDLCAAMDVAHRTGELEEDVARIAAELAPPSEQPDQDKEG